MTAERPPSRFYAAIDAARMECPRCGRLLVWGAGIGRPEQKYWNAVTSMIQCSACLAIYQVGIIAWPSIGRGGQPEDQQLSTRQAGELRQRAGGFWAKQAPRREEETGKVRVNRYIPDGCCCDPLPWRKECPIHGEESLRS